MGQSLNWMVDFPAYHAWLPEVPTHFISQILQEMEFGKMCSGNFVFVFCQKKILCPGSGNLLPSTSAVIASRNPHCFNQWWWFATITMWNPEDRSDGLWLGLPCFMMDISTLFYVYSRSVKFTWLQGGGPQAMYVGSWWLFIMVYDHPHKTSDSYTPKHSDDSSTWMNFWDKPTYSHLHVGPGIQKTPTFPMYFWKPAWVRSSAVEPSEFWYNQQYFCGDTPQLQLHAANPPQEQAIPISISMNIPSFPLISHVFMIFYATFLSIKPLKSRPWHDTPTIPLNGSSTSPR
jgi:hypothetical protein